MTLALWEFDTLAGPGICLCGRPLPKRPPYRPAAKHCSYWCFLVEHGPEFYTLERIEPHLLKIRGRIPIHSRPEGNIK